MNLTEDDFDVGSVVLGNSSGIGIVCKNTAEDKTILWLSPMNNSYNIKGTLNYYIAKVSSGKYTLETIGFISSDTLYKSIKDAYEHPF